ncbi:MAG: hypothetical protein M0Z28_31820 [Rhodospirillales bacterium]|nr:hypothetical protein [Rhodospirillales bacterium]
MPDTSTPCAQGDGCAAQRSGGADNARVGEQNGRSRLTARAVRRIRQAVRDGAEQKDLAEAYGVHHSAIWQAVHRRTWKHVA